MWGVVRVWWRWRTNILLTLISLLAGVVPARAAFEYVGGGAQALSLGRAFAAAARGTESIWYNPAGNARMERMAVGTTHARLYPHLDEGLSLSAMDVMVPVRRGSLQAGFSSFGFDGWREKVGVVGYGWVGNPRLSLGSSLQLSSWEAGRLRRRSWHWDLGGVYEVGWVLPQAYLRGALVLSNLTGANISAAGHKSGSTSRGVVLGASIGNEFNELLVDVERRRGRTEVRLGYENRALYMGGIDLRVGGVAQIAEWEARELDGGVGYGWKNWQLDYAYTYPLQLSGLGGTHWVSLSFQRP